MDSPSKPLDAGASYYPAKVWELNPEKTEYVLQVQMGAGQINFTWDGTYLTTNDPEPVFPTQPAVSGAQTL